MILTDPAQIERCSMEIIAPYLKDLALTPQEAKVCARIIHAAGDPDYAGLIRIHPQAVAAGCAALAGGCDVYTDVEMVRTGINKRRLAAYGGTVHCRIGEARVADMARRQGITRAMAAMRTYGAALDGAVVAVGNAPTALFALLDLMEQNGVKPALIVGVPVGFVGAREAKEALMAHAAVPYITVVGNKGGSPIAAAAVNALLYMLGERA